MGISEGMGDVPRQPRREFGFEPPREEGFDTVNTVKAMREGRVRFFLGLGGNFLSAAPGTELTASALKSCELTTHISQSSTARIW